MVASLASGEGASQGEVEGASHQQLPSTEGEQSALRKLAFSTLEDVFLEIGTIGAELHRAGSWQR